jgi:hypothetical protein
MEEWAPAVNAMEAALGIDRDSPLFARVHHMFLHVNPRADFGNPF